MLADAPELEGQAWFEFFLAQPESGLEQKHRRYLSTPGLLLARHARAAEREVFFPQRQTPGLSMQLDWTKANELGITIGGHPLDHLLCHGLSVAVFKPGVGQPLPVRVLPEPGPWAASQPRAAGQKKPRHLGTGHSSTATHESSPGSGPRGFNPDDLDLGQHFDLSPVTFNAACPPEHGDVESQNGHRKRSSKQPLLLRGSRDFESEEADDQLVAQVMAPANRPCGGAGGDVAFAAAAIGGGGGACQLIPLPLWLRSFHLPPWRPAPGENHWGLPKVPAAASGESAGGGSQGTQAGSMAQGIRTARRENLRHSG